MVLPATVRVKLSSEEAAWCSVTPVVIREMPLAELVELMLGATGKNLERIHDLLRRGSFVSGATRFRWSGFEADPAALAGLLNGFPDPEPARPFLAARCVRFELKGPYCRIEIAREPGQHRRWLEKSNFWDQMLKLASAGELEYVEYSYKDRADRYRLKLTTAAAEQVRGYARLLPAGGLASRIRSAQIDCVDFFVPR